MMLMSMARTVLYWFVWIKLLFREQHHENVNDDDDVQHRYQKYKRRLQSQCKPSEASTHYRLLSRNIGRVLQLRDVQLNMHM